MKSYLKKTESTFRMIKRPNNYKRKSLILSSLRMHFFFMVLVGVAYGQNWPDMSIGNPYKILTTGTPIAGSYGSSSFEKPNQKRIFTHDGSLFAVITLNVSGSGDWYLYKSENGTWTPKIALHPSSSRNPDIYIDNQNNKLYIFHGNTSTDNFYRLTYNTGSKSWSIDSGFPVSVSGTYLYPSLTRGYDGTLYIFTEAASSLLTVNWSYDNGATWNGPSTIANVGGFTGCTAGIEYKYSNFNYVGVIVGQNNGQPNFKYYYILDGDDPGTSTNWGEETLPVSPTSDDHVAITKDYSQNLYAIVKLSDAGASDYVLYKRSSNTGNWTTTTINGGGTRPSLMIDEDNDKIYFFRSSGSYHYVKYASTDKNNPTNISSGDWFNIIDNGGIDKFNNLTVSHQILTASTDLTVIVPNETQQNLWYNTLDLSYTPPDDIIITEVHSHATQNSSYMEIYNNGVSPINLSGYSLRYFDNGSKTATATENLSGTIAAGQYLVLAKNGSSFLGTYGQTADFTNSGFTFDGGDDGIDLYDGTNIIDQFNCTTEVLQSWTVGHLFERFSYPNGGSNPYLDYTDKGTNQVGTPQGQNDTSLPVSLISFTANADQSDYARLNWKTASEIDNFLWIVSRREIDMPFFAPVTTIPGNGSTSETSYYEYTDYSVEPGKTYEYLLSDVSTNGKRTKHNPVEIFIPELKTYALFQNYPNPFNPKTSIRFALPEPGMARIDIYNNLGQKVKTLLNSSLLAGEHMVQWDGTDNYANRSPSGIYLYRLTTNSGTLQRKMYLLR